MSIEIDLDELERLAEELRGFGAAYPEDIFTPLTDEERKQMGSLLDRASAGMGRHMAKWMVKAADAIERLQAENAELRRDAEKYRGCQCSDPLSAWQKG